MVIQIIRRVPSHYFDTPATEKGISHPERAHLAGLRAPEEGEISEDAHEEVDGSAEPDREPAHHRHLLVAALLKTLEDREHVLPHGPTPEF